MRFTASVITGHGIGRELGYPTLNFQAPEGLALAEGVFACRIHFSGDIGQKSVPGVLFFGRRATFADTTLSLEVHLLDWIDDIQIEQAEIEIIEHIREPQRFASRDELIAAIAQDCAQARKILAHPADNL